MITRLVQGVQYLLQRVTMIPLLSLMMVHVSMDDVCVFSGGDGIAGCT